MEPIELTLSCRFVECIRESWTVCGQSCTHPISQWNRCAACRECNGFNASSFRKPNASPVIPYYDTHSNDCPCHSQCNASTHPPKVDSSAAPDQANVQSLLPSVQAPDKSASLVHSTMYPDAPSHGEANVRHAIARSSVSDAGGAGYRCGESSALQPGAQPPRGIGPPAGA